MPSKGVHLTGAFAALLVGVTIAAPARCGALPHDTISVSRASTEHRLGLGRVDIELLALSVGATGWAAHNDRWLTSEALEAHSVSENRLASAVQPLGNAGVVAPVLLVSYGLARWTGHDKVAQAVAHVGAAIGVAGAVTLALKEAVGRSRPYEAPGDPTRFRPFSGHMSFPSGHATIAFASVAAIDDETTAPWFPWVAYPAAALLGWSRVHEREHWTSDVVAGAAIGMWTAHKTDSRLRTRGSRTWHVDFGLAPAPGGARVALWVQPTP
jgi:membrane-associated phospholipid phosphatase